MTNVTNNKATQYCKHGESSDHDWEANNSQVLVCLADSFFWELPEDVQDRLRENNPRNLHCTCCHRNLSNTVAGVWDYEEDGGTPGYGMCPWCNAEECGVVGFMEQCRHQVACTKTPKRCREAGVPAIEDMMQDVVDNETHEARLEFERGQS